jgi:hypothetical protein
LNNRDGYGDLPIHCVAVACPPVELLNELLQGFSEGARFTDASGNLPIHLLVRSLGKSQKPIEQLYPAVEALVNAFPKGVIIPDEHSKLPIQLLLESSFSSPERTRLQVLLGFPYDVNGLADNWHCLLQHPESCDSEDSVTAIILEAKMNRGLSIEQVAYATDAMGREAHAVATTSNRRCLWRHLLLLGRS